LPSASTASRRLANNEIAVQVDAIDETVLMVGVQKVANRITMGLLLAALIIGAAMLMQVETPSGSSATPPGDDLLPAGRAGCVALMATILFSDKK